MGGLARGWNWEDSVGVQGSELDKCSLVIGVGLKSVEELGDMVLELVMKIAKNEVMFG